MSEQANTDVTVDSSFVEQGQNICRQFAEAWEEALQGGQPPHPEAYLAQIGEPERSMLHQQLSRIAQEYHQRWRSQRSAMEHLSPTIDDEGAVAEGKSDLTQELSDDTRRDAASMDSNPEQIASEQKREPAPSSADGLATVAHEAAPLTALRDGSASLPAQRSSPAGRPCVPGYEIVEELGRGGMGVVYKARQEKLNRIVALKMVLAGAHASAQQLARFEAEAEAVAQLQHPGIVQIFEVGEHDGLPFFSLEFVEGGSLADRIDGKPQPPREAAQILQALARAMAVAHQNGIIHRDLKPANVLLTAEGKAKITDFGLAKRIEGASELTRTGALMGSPSYMSPEQARGGTSEIGPRSDLYSLGAILYELLTGRPPFVGPSILETLEQVRNQEPVPPSHLQPKVPRDLETICLKCLRKESDRRYSGCDSLTEDLRRFLDGEPIRARRVSKAERLWRWCRRNPRVALLGVVVAVLLGLVVASTVAMKVRLDREQQTIAETRKMAGERLEQAATAIRGGDSRRARDLLHQANLPLLDSSPELADTQAQLKQLRQQVDVYVEFETLLDQARFTCFGSPAQKKEGQDYCRRLVGLYDRIEERTGVAASGLPPLDEEQRQRFTEDVFDAFLIASIVERDLAAQDGEAAQKKAAERALDLLNRANRLLPETRAFYANRAACWGKLGDQVRDEADAQRARAIEPTSANDHFWHGFAHHLRGDKALRKGDRKEADEFYRKELAEYAAFLRLRPDRFWGYFNWSLAHVQLGNWQEALFGFTACIHLRPDFPWSYNNRGNVLLRLKRYEPAIEDCSAALARNDRYVEALENRGLAYLGLGKTEPALHDFDRAIDLKPDHAPLFSHRADVLRKLKRPAEALRDQERLLELGADKVQVHLQRADTYREMNRISEAIQEADRAIALDGKNVQAYYLRGGLHVAARHYAQAHADFSTVLARVPRAVNVLRDRAVLNWMLLKDFDAALADAEQLVRLQPKNPEPHRILGSIYLGQRQYEKALRSFRTALDLKPDSIEVQWAVAQVHFRQGDTQKALAVLDSLIAHLSPEMPESLNLRGDIYRSLGRLDDAIKDYRRIIELRPKTTDAYIGLALVLDRQGAGEKAREAQDRMVAANPDAALVYLRRAEYHRNHGDFTAALADCERAAGKDPKSALPALVRASIAAAQGQHQQAVAEAERALGKAPKDDGHVLYAAASVWSLASQAAAAETDVAQRYADRAVSLLNATLDKGFHDLIFPEHNRMIEDPSLAPIRQRPQVRDLLALPMPG